MAAASPFFFSSTAACSAAITPCCLSEGMPADVLVYDYANLRVCREEKVYDFPGGEWRRIERAVDNDYSTVHGVIIFGGWCCPGTMPMAPPAAAWPQMALAMGCSEPSSAHAAVRSSSCGAIPSAQHSTAATASARNGYDSDDAHDAVTILHRFAKGEDAVRGVLARAVGPGRTYVGRGAPGAGADFIVNSPLWVEETPKVPPRLAPEIGEHTEEVLRSLGLPDEELNTLERTGVIAVHRRDSD